MASVMVAPPLPGPSTSVPSTSMAANSKQPTFEFTRRKRWAELLINELSEAIGLVLSPAGRILFCSPSVTEILGWRDQELIDVDFTELVNADNRLAFRNTLGAAIQQHTDVLSYVRLRCKDPAISLQSSMNANMVGVSGLGDYGYAIPTAGSSTSVPAQPPQLLAQTMATSVNTPKEVLFEITGYPHFVEQDEEERHHTGIMLPQCKCIFAVAKPYPSRNTAMLNTFLELKMENERLQQRLVDIKSRPRSAPTSSHRTQKRPRADTATQAPAPPPQRPSLSPIIPHPYSHQTQLGHPPTPTNYNSMPVSMQMPMSSLAASASGGGTNAYPSSTYAQSNASFYSPASFADYGVGVGMGASGSGYSGYAQQSGPSSGLAALAIASAVAATPGATVGDRGVSFGAPAGATDHRRMSLPGGAPVGNQREEEEEGGRKKKVRRHVGEQYVCRTCGRTDSPEWRKGPLGPKTLCNACGLRWAKQVRKGDEKDKDEGGD